jgi:DNA-binding SARP family transcriptional activator
VNAIRFFLFRDFRLEMEEHIINGLVAQKPRELLCYLLLHRNRPFLREALMSLLWEESDTNRAKKYFRQTLWQLQNDLQIVLGDLGERLLSVDSDWIQFNDNIKIWSDVDAFQQVFKDTQGVSGSALNNNQLQTLKTAEKLYRGDLLEGWYQDWCIFERERLQNIYLMLLDKLLDYCETNYLFEEGIDYGMRILKIDIAREKTHQCLMRLYHNIGDRTNALRQYQRCVTILKTELGVSPSQRTEQLVEHIKRDSSDFPNSPIATSTQREQYASRFRLVYHLNQLRHHLSDAHQKINQDFETVQNILLEDK